MNRSIILEFLRHAVEDLLSAKYQGVHNEMVASALITKYAHAHYPDNEIGMMPLWRSILCRI